ncbi:hypothetical protein T261_0793 [Streptomyces lydicus]|nr:hypothetical protein T261_0793 [Streptomyces lydicus]
MDDNPLEEFARRQEARRERLRGKLRAVLLTEGPHRGAHVAPEAPRMIERHTGYGWEPFMIVSNYAAAQRILNPPSLATAEDRPDEWDRPALARGRGRHRKPSARGDSA